MPNNTTNTQEPTTDTILVNTESLICYMILEISKGRSPLDNTGAGREYVTGYILSQIGSNRQFRVNPDTVAQKYRSAAPEEFRYITSRLDELFAAGRPFKASQIPAEEGGQVESSVCVLVQPDHRHDFSRIIIHEEAKKQIDLGLKKIEMAKFLNEEWGLKEVEPFSGKCALNMYGPPGTGKTIAALAIAKKLGKPLLQTDYSQIISKYYGDTAKHIKECFDEAKKHGAVLFFDEADSLLSKRAPADSGQANSGSMNQNRNVLMQEIDRFDGIIIFTTNLFSNYDDAILRRIAQHIEFKLPNEEMREKIIRLHIPEKVPQASNIDLQELALKSEGLSGGDIKNVALNAIVEASISDPMELTQTMLLAHLDQVRDSKGAHKYGDTTGVLVNTEEKKGLDDIVVEDKVKEQIDVGLNKINQAEFLENEWNLKSIESMTGKTALNFYGPPGTGKTMAANAIAKKLGLKMFQVDYSNIVSKWVGDTAKHIKQAFDEAKRHKAVLFFDEADGLVSKRVSGAADQTSVNQNRNVLMQEMDKFDGIIIFATNLFGNYDPALLRRIAQHVEFKLPEEAARKDIINLHLPEEVPLSEDFSVDEIAALAKDFSGGDIKNLIINSLVKASISDPKVLTMDIVKTELDNIKGSKSKHGKSEHYKNPRIGFRAESSEEKELVLE